jgi:flagellar protein FliL
MAETQDVEEVEAPEQEGRTRGGILPLVAALLVSVGGGGALGLKALGPALGSRLAASAEASSDTSEGVRKRGKGSEGEALPLHVVDNLVVNPAGSSGARFLLTSIAIQTEAADDTAMLTARDVEIRDAFIMVLGSKTVEQLSDISERAALSDELLKAVQDLVGPGVVSRIFIPQFVIQ